MRTGPPTGSSTAPARSSDLDRDAYRETADSNSWGSGGWAEWDGRNAAGNRVANGTFTIRVTVHTTDETTHSFSRRVTVASGTKWFKRTVSFRGSSFDIRRVNGNCSIQRATSWGEAWLDCWGGRSAYAKVSYDAYAQFDIKAKDFTWWVRGERRCCAPGDVVKSGSRDKHDVLITVKVTNWRAYDVWRVGYSYYALDRI